MRGSIRFCLEGNETESERGRGKREGEKDGGKGEEGRKGEGESKGGRGRETERAMRI